MRKLTRATGDTLRLVGKFNQNQVTAISRNPAKRNFQSMRNHSVKIFLEIVKSDNFARDIHTNIFECVPDLYIVVNDLQLYLKDRCFFIVFVFNHQSFEYLIGPSLEMHHSFLKIIKVLFNLTSAVRNLVK